ncbi:MAG: ATP-dependent helicase [Planctomycetota bacterium]
MDAKRPRLEKFLQDTTLDGDDRFSKDDRFESNAVRLMTLHAAKGLEFPRVYLVGLEEGILPHRKSVETGGAAIEEERRLAYVGITRAKDALIVSRAVARRKWGKLRPSDISRFVFEMRGDGVAEPFESVTAGAEA